MTKSIELGNKLSKSLKELEITVIEEWLKSPDLYLPDFLENVFKKYIHLLSSNPLSCYSISNENLSYISGVCDTISQTVKLYLHGKIFSANKKFKNELESYFEEAHIIRSSHMSFANICDIDRKTLSYGPLYYRARKGNLKSEYKHSDIFHVPFEERNHIENYRFSISGLPCLYLSNNPLVNWLELKEPVLDQLYFSRYFLKKELKFLDLSYYGGEKDLATSHNFFNEESHLISLNSWPLRISCLLPKRKPKGTFHEEYIISQLTLQLVSEMSSVDGVIYQSSKEFNQQYSPNMYNYAIPVKSSLGVGYCPELSKIFEWTQPINFQDLKINKRKNFKHGKFDNFFFLRYNQLVGGNFENTSMGSFKYKNRECGYFTSVFFEIEKRLIDIHTQPLNLS